jgi:hypothetical protein
MPSRRPAEVYAPSLRMTSSPRLLTLSLDEEITFVADHRELATTGVRTRSVLAMGMSLYFVTETVIGATPASARAFANARSSLFSSSTGSLLDSVRAVSNTEAAWAPSDN